ncbi:MAG TPA: polyprenol monophosphomannose synthase [Spirochaetota bacterium]|nr:polyprenol monophosphomannose synthase [Spirochaetota bacterium]
MKTLIITPTYNEKENIADFINAVYENTEGLDINILIVDDGSPDGTALIVKDLIEKKYSNKLFILERAGKQGLASAYITGFKWGIEKNYDVICEMDADFSHNPKYIKPMLEYFKDYDVVIGSRNIKGGAVKGWGFTRNFISKGGSLYSRLVLGCPIKDLTGGFNFWKKEVLVKILEKPILSSGYSFQIELKYKSYKNKFKIKEFPILFEDRTKGNSKMSKNIFFEALLKIWKIRKY